MPDPTTSHSGVTIATGVDLGQFQESHLDPLLGALRAKLDPYIGLKQQDAVTALAKAPLTVTQAEADALDDIFHNVVMGPVEARYYMSTAKQFSSLPDAVQTVVASVAYQYGPLWVHTPKFWATVVHSSWYGMASVLDNFGDDYKTRREAEAAYLRKWLDTIPVA